MKIKLNNIVLGFYALFLFGKIQTRLAIPLFDDNITIVLYCGIILLALLVNVRNKKKIFASTDVQKIATVLILYTLLFSICFREDKLSDYINSYTLAFVAMIIYTICTSVYAFNNRMILSLLKLSYIVISAFLAICFIMYFDNFNTIINISSFFGGEERARSAFGMTHPNTTAEIILAGYSILLFLLSAEKDGYIVLSKNFRKYSYCTALLMGIQMLSTSCRGALLAILIAVLIYTYWKYKDRLKSANKIIFTIISFVMVVILFLYVYIAFISSGIFDIEYRVMNFSINIPLLLSSGRIWFGMGFVEKSVFSRGLIIANSGYTDNYYLYVLTSTGIIGCIFIVFVIWKIWNGISKMQKKYNNSYTSRSVQTINVMTLAFAMTEATYISPVSILSLVTMIIFFVYLMAGDKIFGVSKC